MSTIEKMLGMVRDVSIMRGMYDQVCIERDTLKSERDKALQEASFNGQVANSRLETMTALKAELQKLGELGAHTQDALRRAMARAGRYKEILEKIRDQDYRGNRCFCATEANRILKEVE